jgi:hypothetical protein
MVPTSGAVQVSTPQDTDPWTNEAAFMNYSQPHLMWDLVQAQLNPIPAEWFQDEAREQNLHIDPTIDAELVQEILGAATYFLAFLVSVEALEPELCRGKIHPRARHRLRQLAVRHRLIQWTEPVVATEAVSTQAASGSPGEGGSNIKLPSLEYVQEDARLFHELHPCDSLLAQRFFLRLNNWLLGSEDIRDQK